MRAIHSFYLALSAAACLPSLVAGLTADDADIMWNDYNKACLKQSGKSAYYRKDLSSNDPDVGWTAAHSIFAAEDAYERKGDDATKALVEDLCSTWLYYKPLSGWHSDDWNDDIGWYSMVLIRGYQATGNQTFLDAAKKGFDMAFERGWNTTFNDGGIWEKQPEDYKEPEASTIQKEALSTDSLGKVSCLIYQSTHEQHYLDRCVQIYDWLHSHLLNHTTGQIYTGVHRNGTMDLNKQAYNQGGVLEMSRLLWMITGNKTYYDDAKFIMDFGKNNITVDGILSTTHEWEAFWAGEYVRGAVNFVRDAHLWKDYYAFFEANANAIMKNRRPDLNITWNAWAEPTSKDEVKNITSHFSGAVSMLQLTPPSMPNDTVEGIRVIVNNHTGLAIDSNSTWGNGKNALVREQTGANPQRWQFTRNQDKTFNIINLDTWQALRSPDVYVDNNASVVQWLPTRDQYQRWWVEQESNGLWRIYNRATNMSLSDGATTQCGADLKQTFWAGQAQQHWKLEAVVP